MVTGNLVSQLLRYSNTIFFSNTRDEIILLPRR